MADISFITRRLATGGALLTADAPRELVATGITGVISCQSEYDTRPLLRSEPRLEVLWIGVPDDGQPKPLNWFRDGITFALERLALPGARLHVHCGAGQNRGPSMAAAVLMAQGLAAADAEALIRRARPQVTLAYLPDAVGAVQMLGYV